jgi:hypothetical protein
MVQTYDYECERCQMGGITLVTIDCIIRIIQARRNPFVQAQVQILAFKDEVIVNQAIGGIRRLNIKFRVSKQNCISQNK